MHLISGIILAAGGSTRLGQPKQLLMYQGKTLLRRVAQLALALPLREVVVVVGHRPAEMRAELADLPVRIVENPQWPQGMGGSIATGMQVISPDSQGILMLLVDQPKLTLGLLEQLVNGYHTGHELVVADYGGTIGVPALLGNRFFPALRALSTQGGARQILRSHQEEALRISFPEGKLDVDTPADYQRLLDEDND